MNKSELHQDEELEKAISKIKETISSQKNIQKALLIEDLFGKVWTIFWSSEELSQKKRDLILASYNVSKSAWNCGAKFLSEYPKFEQDIYDDAWNNSQVISGFPTFRKSERFRTKGFWFSNWRESPWIPSRSKKYSPPIIVFYSFKGGVGRTTALMSFALQRSRLGERVAILDFDLDAPGVGSTLSDKGGKSYSGWGVADYLLEKNIQSLPLRDYYHLYSNSEASGKGQIFVFPAGRLDHNYIGKISRLDLEPPVGDSSENGVLDKLLNEVREEFQPNWILLDSRAGISNSSGMLLNGVGHLHVLFGTTNEQSWRGLRMVIRRLGEERIRVQKVQAETIIVQSMVPNSVSKDSIDAFRSRSEKEFSECYYSEIPTDLGQDIYWDISSLDEEDAPHLPIPIHYNEKLSFYSQIVEIADSLCDISDYRNLAKRILDRFSKD